VAEDWAGKFLMVRFLHTSDWQIGMKGAALGDAGPIVGEERIRCVDRVLSIAEENDAAFVLAAGDLFEDNGVSDDVVEAVARILHGHPDMPVHAIPGNHDLPGPGCVWNRAALRGVPHLRVYRQQETVPAAEGVVLHAFPVISRYAGTDPLAELPDLGADDFIHIGMAHGHLTTVTFGAHEDEVRLPIDPAHVERSGLDYLALGHWHGARLERTSEGVCRIAYSGTHEQSSYRETDAGNVLIVGIAGKGVPPQVHPVRSGRLVWQRLELAFAGDENLDRLETRLRESSADLLRLELAGALPLRLTGAYENLLAEVEPRFRNLRVRDADLRWVAEEGGDSAPIADAALAEVATVLEQRAAEGQDAATARKALSIFHRIVAEAGL
jgi:DNA repair exonuclease SbcCD nuclease subunit